MRPPLPREDFSRLTGVPVGELDRYTSAGLLDPDGDGVFDELDLLRLRFVLGHIMRGATIDEILAGIDDGSISLVAVDLLYGPRARFTISEAAARVGISPEQITSLRTAVGLVDTTLTIEDIRTFEAVRNLVDLGLPWEAVLEAARVYGDSLRRIAETEMRIFLAHVQQPLEAAGAGVDELAVRTEAFTEALGPLIDPLILYLHRQYLLRATVAHEMALLEASHGAGGHGEHDSTIMFVDLASFTPLAQVHGDEVAASVLDRFDSLVRTHVLAHRGTLVKQIGDAFMLTFPSAADAVRCAVAIDEAAAAEPGFPALRSGIHSGPVLYRSGDYIGHTVNLASRVAAVAGPSDILLTEPVAAAARAAGVAVEEWGAKELRGVKGPVTLYRVVRTGARATRRERDPVCGMLVTEPAGRLLLGGFEFVFCSEECLRTFLADPAAYS